MVVVKHISGIRGLVRIPPPATITGHSTFFAHSVWQQPPQRENLVKSYVTSGNGSVYLFTCTVMNTKTKTKTVFNIHSVILKLVNFYGKPNVFYLLSYFVAQWKPVGSQI